MKGTNAASNILCDSNDGEEESAAVRMKEVTLGDLIWVKLHGKAWWPAQVVDEKSVSRSSKPGNKAEGEILVRLYGSYNYLYADPIKSISEFKMTIKQNSGGLKQILEKALKQDSSHPKSRRSKGQESKSMGTGNKRLVASNDKRNSNQNRVKRNQENASSPRKIKPKHKISNEEKGGKSSKQDGVQRKSKPRNVNGKDDKKSKTSRQDDMQRKRKLNSLTSEDADSRTPKPDESWKQRRLNSPTHEATSSRKSSARSSARRMRVMQRLALIAPAGSPFHKSGNV